MVWSHDEIGSRNVKHGMISVSLVLALVLASSILSSSPVSASPGVKPETDDQKFSYYMGLEFGSALRQAMFKVDPKMVDLAIQDVIQGNKPALSQEELIEIRKTIAEGLRQRRTAMVKAVAEKNQREGEAFLQQNGNKPGVTVTASGLQYEVLAKGTGRRPSAMDQVTVHYTGSLLDGRVFDSSKNRDKPLTIPLSSVIPGWTEGVQLMNVGSKYRFFIPSRLAYGANGPGGLIGPNATLIFEVELLGIQ